MHRFIIIFFFGLPAFADDPFERPPINYSNSKPDNIIERLKLRLESNEVEWTKEKNTGYLRGLLKALDISIESQTLVYSKTSFQAKLIEPARPRALYFNDDIYVGYVPKSNLLELSVADPKLGAVFYTFDQDNISLERETSDCLSCHGTSRTGHTPGHLLRSVTTKLNGHIIFRAGTELVNHTTEYGHRWGGWYADGTRLPAQNHANLHGKITSEDDLSFVKYNEKEQLSNFFDSELYLSNHSDVVALMVQDHQVEMHNLFAKANHRTRVAIHYQKIMDEALNRDSTCLSESTSSIIANMGDKLLSYLLFTNEIPLPNPIKGSTNFEKIFSQRKPRDNMNRSLYELDLETRLLKYPCSYLIYSDTFEQLPVQMKDYLYKKLWDILNDTDPSYPIKVKNSKDRKNIKEILLSTKSDLPKYWKI